MRPALISDDSKQLLTTTRYRELVSYDMETGEIIKSTPQLETITKSADKKMIIRQSTDGSVILTYNSHDGTVSVRDGNTLETNKEFVLLDENEKTFSDLVLSPNGRYLVAPSSDSPKAQVWDVETGKLYRELISKKQSGFPPAVEVKFHASSKYVYVQHNISEANIWDIDTGDIILGPAVFWVFHADDRIIRYLDIKDGFVKNLEISTRKVTSLYDANYNKNDHIVTYPWLSSDGNHLLVVNGIDTDAPSANWEYYTLNLWDLKAQKIIQSFGKSAPADAGEASNIITFRPRQISLSSDGLYAKVNFGGGRISIWDTRTGKKVFEDTETAWTAQFSPDGKRLVIRPKPLPWPYSTKIDSQYRFLGLAYRLLSPQPFPQGQ